MDNDAGDEIVVQSSLRLSRVIVDSTSIFGEGGGGVHAQGGGGNETSNAAVPRRFCEEMKGMKVSSHYLFHT